MLKPNAFTNAKSFVLSNGKTVAYDVRFLYTWTEYKCRSAERNI